MLKNKFWGNGNEDGYIEYHLPFDLHAVIEDDAIRGKIVERGGHHVNTAGLVWIVSGQCRVFLCGEERILNGGQMFYVLFRDNYRLEVLSEKLRYRQIGFSGPLAEAVLLSYHFPRFLDMIRDAEPVWNGLVSLASSHSEFDRRHIAALILELFACVSSAEMFENPGERLIEQGMRLILRHLADPELSVDFLCEKLSVSRSRLTEQFHKYQKYSPGRVILNKRLVRAYSLLRGTDHPIAKVAEECGFRDPKTFSRFIRRASGVGPQAFRGNSRRESDPPREGSPEELSPL